MTPETEEPALAEALTMTGLKTAAELIDMAKVGQSLMERIADLVKQDGPFAGWMPADDPAEIVFDLVNHYEDAAASRAPAAARDCNQFWLILHDPGCVPKLKGPWKGGYQAQVLREFMTARPTAYIDVLSVSEIGPLVQHGPEVLQMLDGRSMARGRRHNAQTREAHAPHHAASPEGVGEMVGNWVMVPREPTREMWAAMGNALYGHRNRHHDAVAQDFWTAALEAAPKLNEDEGSSKAGAA